MLPKKELQALAAAIKSTPEYAGIMQRRKKIFGSPRLAGLMQNFEREHTRILRSGVTEEEIDSRLKKLYADNKSFLEHEEIKDYIKATQEYHEMISGHMRYLNELLDMSHGR